ALQPFEEVADRHLQRAGDLPESRGRDAVGAALVLLDLLESHAARHGELLLGQAEQTSPPAHALAQMEIDVVTHDEATPLGILARVVSARFAAGGASGMPFP